jgi:MFS family permease
VTPPASAGLAALSYLYWTLIAVSVATFMLHLDITVVNVALPAIRDDLVGNFTDLQWVVDAYALTLAALVLTAGSLAERLGRRKVFAAGLAIFAKLPPVDPVIYLARTLVTPRHRVPAG